MSVSNWTAAVKMHAVQILLVGLCALVMRATLVMASIVQVS